MSRATRHAAGLVAAAGAPLAADARALAASRAALARDPGDRRALFTLAALLLRAGDPEAASLLPRLDHHPTFAGGWLAVADALLDRQQVGAALAAASRALRAEPALAAAHHLSGRILRAGGRDGDAEQAFRRAAAYDPAAADSWFALALLLQDRGDAAAAAECYRSALRARPALHEAAFNLGVALGDSGRVDEAMDAYGLALRLRPDSFGRIAQSLASGRSGVVFLDPARLRAELAGRRPPV